MPPTGRIAPWPSIAGSHTRPSNGSGKPGGSNLIWSRPSRSRRTRTSEDKLIDVVGLYMNPPDGAIVFSFDEKSRIQARTPLNRACRSSRVNHDYKATAPPRFSLSSTSSPVSSSVSVYRSIATKSSWPFCAYQS